MAEYLRLLLMAALPAALAAAFWLLQTRTPFGSWRMPLQQAVIGGVYGAAAVVGIQLGTAAAGTGVSICDAMPLCAGLLFGGPAGILAGLLAGAGYLAVLAHGGTTVMLLGQLLAAVLAGALAAVLRRILFDGRRPDWRHTVTIGFVMETINLLLVCLTNYGTIEIAIRAIIPGAVLLMCGNALAVLLASLAVSVLAKEPLLIDFKNPKITQKMQMWLLATVAIAFLASSFFTFTTQTRTAMNGTLNTLQQSIDDTCDEVTLQTEDYMRNMCDQIAYTDVGGLTGIDHLRKADVPDVNGNGVFDEEDVTALLQSYCESYSVSELNIVGAEGKIRCSSNPDYIGFDMAARTEENKQAYDFYHAIQKSYYYVQDMMPTAYNHDNYYKYVGIRLSDSCVLSSGGGFLQMGFDTERFHEEVSYNMEKVANCRHVGQSGTLMVVAASRTVQSGWTIVSMTTDLTEKTTASGMDVSSTGLVFEPDAAQAGKLFTGQAFGQEIYYMYEQIEGYYIIATLPTEEAMRSRNVSAMLLVLMETLVFALVFALVYYCIKRLVVDDIQKVNASLAQITAGNLDEKVQADTTAEFRALSGDINVTVDKLKQLIAEAAARMDTELEFAKGIQHSALPSVFPPYPGHTEFTIWAGMTTAHEVGGDFYDFYLLGEDQLAFLVADVSGKGVPAALFMMNAKTLIKSLMETGLPVGQALDRANAQLCNGNAAGMFVTAWLGVLNLHTGTVEYVNAGHNAPLVNQEGEGYRYLKHRSGLMLAAMEESTYKTYTMQLTPGDTLYLYTDGVTEATDNENHLYGDQRLLRYLNANTGLPPQELCSGVKADVDAFVGSAPQFDDITMLCLTWHGAAQGTDNE